MQDKELRPTSRRNFLGALATGTAAASLAAISAPINASAKSIADHLPAPDNDPDEWFKQIKGKHRIVFDATRPHEIMPFVWPLVFLNTNEATGTPAKDNSVVVVLRHSAIPYAFNNAVWEKYKFADTFKAADLGPAFTKNEAYKNAASKGNPFWQPKADDFAVPGIGNIPIGINDLQAKGVMFCVCNAAINVNSAVVAQQMGLKPEDVKKDWMAGLLPGVQVVPSGVWAVGRAQEHGCAYCFAG